MLAVILLSDSCELMFKKMHLMVIESEELMRWRNYLHLGQL